MYKNKKNNINMINKKNYNKKINKIIKFKNQIYKKRIIY